MWTQGIGDGDGAEAPERQLWCAVVGLGVQDATRVVGLDAGAPLRQRQRDEARDWIARNDADFRLACELAGFDPDDLRRRVLARLDDR